jgi:hypothetical protein
MTCDYSNLCGAESKITSGGNNSYVKNGEGARHTPLIFENNHVYMPYVELSIGTDIYVTGDAPDNWPTTIEICDIPSYISIFFKDKMAVQFPYNVATTKSYIQSFEMTVGKSFEGSIVIVTCDYAKVNRLLNITPQETCEWDKYELGDDRERVGAVIGYINIGWIIKGCNGDTKKYTMKEMNESVKNNYKTEDDQERNSGPYIYGIFKKVDVAAENGVYKITMTFVDGFSFNEESKLDKIWGEEKMKLDFKAAIIAASKFNCNTRKDTGLQKIARLSFKDGNINSNPPWKFDIKFGGEKGPKSVWNSWRQGLFPFLREISNYLLTSRKKGWWFAYDNGSCSEPTILMVEDRNPSLCLKEKDLFFEGGRSITTYIVNGGDCSPVIKFNPSFNAVPVQNNGNSIKSPRGDIGVGGGGPSALDQEPIQILDCASTFNANGTKTITQTNRNNNNSANGTLGNVSGVAEAMNFLPPKDIVKESAEAIYNQAKTEAEDGNAMNLFAPIRASLEIHGDPYWANSINLFKDFFIKIIFLNAYCIEKNAQGDGCDFLQKPKCNSRFSGIYKVGSAKHSISAGSYVTTLELYSISSDDQMEGTKAV